MAFRNEVLLGSTHRNSLDNTRIVNTIAPRILAIRPSKSHADLLEVLCLRKGESKRFRLFTTTAESLQEEAWDLDPVEFDDPDEKPVSTYLIESFWLIRVDVPEIRNACELYDKGIVETPVGELNTQSVTDLGSLGILLIESFNRIQTIDPKHAYAVDALEELKITLDRLEAIPNLPTSVKQSIYGCRLVYSELREEAEWRKRQLNH